MAEVIERPCTSCGISVDKGVRIVAIGDVISGCVLLIIWAVVLSILWNNPPAQFVAPSEPLEHYRLRHLRHEHEVVVAYYRLEVGIVVTLVVFAVIQIMFGFLLYYGQAKRNTTVLNTWLIVSGFSVPANGLLIKVYEMIVVFTFTDEIKCEEQAEALEKFRQLPYVCKMKTQWYPESGSWEWDQTNRNGKGDHNHNQSQNQPYNNKNGSSGPGPKVGMAFYQSKSFVINGPPESVFSAVTHHQEL